MVYLYWYFQTKSATKYCGLTEAMWRNLNTSTLRKKTLPKTDAVIFLKVRLGFTLLLKNRCTHSQDEIIKIVLSFMSISSRNSYINEFQKSK